MDTDLKTLREGLGWADFNSNETIQELVQAVMVCLDRIDALEQLRDAAWRSKE